MQVRGGRGSRVLEANNKVKVRETILEVGGEGGSIVLSRERDAGGAWKFRMGSEESAAYDMLSDEDRAGLGPAVAEPGVVHSFPEGLALLDTYPWFRLFPLQVHPEYRDAILDAVKERGGPQAAACWLSRLARLGPEN